MSCGTSPLVFGRHDGVDSATWLCNARFLSEVPRWIAYERAVEDEAGVRSIRALAVSRWCGVLDAASYGF